MKSSALLCRCPNTTSSPKRSNSANNAPTTTSCAMLSLPMTKQRSKRSCETTWRQRCNCARWKKLGSRLWRSMRFWRRGLKLLILYSGLKTLCSQRSLECYSGQRSHRSKPSASSMMTRTAPSREKNSRERSRWWRSTISQPKRSTSSGTHSIWTSLARLTYVSSRGNLSTTALEIVREKSSSSRRWSKPSRSHQCKVLAIFLRSLIRRTLVSLIDKTFRIYSGHWTWR